MNGQGILKNSNGTVYEGEWKNHQPHGKGSEVFADKSSFKGDFVYGKKSGFG